MFLFNYYSYLKLTLIPSTKDIDNQNKQNHNKSPDLPPFSVKTSPKSQTMTAVPLSGPRTGQRRTDPPDRLLTRIPSAAHAAGEAECSWLSRLQVTAVSSSQMLDRRRLTTSGFDSFSCTSLPPLTPPNNWAVSPPDFFFSSDCVTLSSTEEGWREWKQEKQERLFSHRVNPCHYTPWELKGWWGGCTEKQRRCMWYFWASILGCR